MIAVFLGGGGCHRPRGANGVFGKRKPTAKGGTVHTGRKADPALTQWDEYTVYQLLERVTVLDRERIRVTLRSGVEVEHRLEQPRRRQRNCR